MLEQTAEVTRVSADGVWVRAVEPEGGCGSCGGQGCSTRRLAELFQGTSRQFQVDCALPLVPGDRVVVGIAEGSVLRSALRLYGLPLLLMLLGALLAQSIVPGDMPAVIGVLAGAALGAWLVRGGQVARPSVVRREDDKRIFLTKG